MRVLQRLLSLVVALPIAILLIALAVANRHQVPLVLDPIQPDQPTLSLELPFFIYLFGALVLGVILGGVAAWLSQSRYRKAARVESRQAAHWRQEADRLTRERDEEVASRQKLMLPAGE